MATESQRRFLDGVAKLAYEEHLLNHPDRAATALEWDRLTDNAKERWIRRGINQYLGG